ncbi:MAG: winged helix-turn-helix domain-containing protein [Sphingomonadales bacterium]
MSKLMGEDSQILQIDDLTVNIERSQVRRADELIVLPDLSWRLFLRLIEVAPKPATVEDLLETVWDDITVSNETLTQRVALLRKSLGDNNAAPRYIRTIRSRGYQLIPGPVPIGDGTATAATGPAARASRSWIWIGGAVLALGFFAAIMLGQDQPAETPATQPDVLSETTSTAELIAKGAEFLGRLQRDDNEHAVSLFEEALSRDPRNVDALAGLSIALARRFSKFELDYSWAEKAAELAAEAVRLAPGSATAHHALGLANDSRGDIVGALANYREAVRLDPNHARALASAAHLMTIQGNIRESLEWNLAAARLDSGLYYVEAQTAHALYLLELDQPARGILERVILLKPNNVTPYMLLAQLDLTLGRSDEARRVIGQAREAGLRYAALHILTAQMALETGDRAGAIKAFGEANGISQARQPAHGYLKALDIQKALEDGAASDYQSAVKAYREGIPTFDLWPIGSIIEAYLHAAAGKHPEAITALQTAYDKGYRDWRFMLRDPLLDGLRKLPAFEALVGKMRRSVAFERTAIKATGLLPESYFKGS